MEIDTEYVVVEGPGRVGIHAASVSTSPSTILVTTSLSGISLGTELAIVSGAHPAHTRGYDWRRGLFGASETVAPYPIASLGYMQTGVITLSGDSGLAVGTRVAMASGHRTAHLAVDATGLTPLPDELSNEAGLYVSTLGPVAANALLHAAVVEAGRSVDDLGRGVKGKRVVVLGGGAVGIFVALMSAEHGALSVVVVERDQWRRSVIESLGLETFDDSNADAGGEFRTRWSKHADTPGGADVAFQTRPIATSVGAALRSVRPAGLVVDLAFHTGSASGLFLGEEFHHGSMWLVSAQIDRLPYGTETLWSRGRLARETLRFLAAHPAAVSGLITKRVPFAEAPALFSELSANSTRQLTPVLTF